MNRHMAIGAALLALAFTAHAGDSDSDKNKNKKPPFYRSYLVNGDALDDKIREQEKKIEADPNSAALRNDFGNLLAARRFPADARRQYQMAMKLDKRMFIAPYNLGILEETEGNAGAAISAYQESIKRKPGFPPSRFRLGRLYERNGSTDQAIEQYAKALRIDQSMRDRRRNPLVVDTVLLGRVSLTNYERDLAAAGMATEVRWADEGRFARTPVDRALSADEAAGTPLTGTPPVVAPASVGVAIPSSSSAPAVVVPSPAPTPSRPALPPGAPPMAPMQGGRPIPPPVATPRPN